MIPSGSFCLPWKGIDMAKEYAKGFYQSTQWERCRASYIAYRRTIDGGLCEICRERPGYIVHHKKHISPSTINNPSVTIDHQNLQYVCQDCHNAIHRGAAGGAIEGMVRYRFTPDGKLMPVSEAKGTD